MVILTSMEITTDYKIGYWTNDPMCSNGRVLKRINVVVMTEGSNLPVATLTAGEIIQQHGDDNWSIHSEAFLVSVDANHRRKGLATKMYDLADKISRSPIIPSSELSDDAIKVWLARDPFLHEAVLRAERCYGVMPDSWVQRTVVQVPVNWQT